MPLLRLSIAVASGGPFTKMCVSKGKVLTSQENAVVGASSCVASSCDGLSISQVARVGAPYAAMSEQRQDAPLSPAEMLSAAKDKAVEAKTAVAEKLPNFGKSTDGVADPQLYDMLGAPSTQQPCTSSVHHLACRLCWNTIDMSTCIVQSAYITQLNDVTYHTGYY